MVNGGRALTPIRKPATAEVKRPTAVGFDEPGTVAAIIVEGDRRKVRIARQLRQETTMTLQWIADRLKMGTWTHVANRLYHLKK
jgi:hypothetical protein